MAAFLALWGGIEILRRIFGPVAVLAVMGLAFVAFVIVTGAVGDEAKRRQREKP